MSSTTDNPKPEMSSESVNTGSGVAALQMAANESIAIRERPWFKRKPIPGAERVLSELFIVQIRFAFIILFAARGPTFAVVFKNVVFLRYAETGGALKGRRFIDANSLTEGCAGFAGLSHRNRRHNP